MPKARHETFEPGTDVPENSKKPARAWKFVIVPTDVVPQDEDGVVDSMYDYPSAIQSADGDVQDSNWGVSEGTRQKQSVTKTI